MKRLQILWFDAVARVLILLGVPDTSRILHYALTRGPLVVVALGVSFLVRAGSWRGATPP